MTQCLKIITRQGCERIIRYAFEYARTYGRKKVTCFSKDNIMKMTDGLFHSTFNVIGQEYPDIVQEHIIVDIGTARIATQPELFDVVVMENLYGDIISDVTAEMTGSVGLVGTANIGSHCAMFEAIHGSAPTMANQDIANPSACILASVMMLVHIGQATVAERIHNAWLTTLEQGIHTPDIYTDTLSRQRVGTQAFTQAVIQHLGSNPTTLRPVSYQSALRPMHTSSVMTHPVATKTLVGVDIFVDHGNQAIESLAQAVQAAAGSTFKLSSITNRGAEVWPKHSKDMLCVDQYRCRLLGASNLTLSHGRILEVLAKLAEGGIDFVKTEQLYTFDGQAGYSKDT